MNVIIRRTCTWCLSSADIGGPCRNCGLTHEQALVEHLNWPDEEDES